MDMWKKVLCVLLCATYSTHCYAKAVRQVEADENKVVLINTALGYSTIVEFSSKPQSAVLGDQDAFKLEYVGNSITLKPLIPHAKSNLFVFTEYDRFNCTVRTVSPTEVDYIIKVSPPSRSYPVQAEVPRVSGNQGPKPRVRKIETKSTWSGFTFTLHSRSEIKGTAKARTATVFEFELESKRYSYAFSAGSFGVKQAERFIPIESIYLDDVRLTPGHKAVQGKIVLLSGEFKTERSLQFIFAVPGHLIQITVPGVTSPRGK